jgi:DNA polymerase (family 10)
MKTFIHLPHVKEVLMHGPTKSSIVTHENIQVDLRVVEKDSYGAALAYFTGSKAHNIRIREMAMKRGLKINEYGIFRESDNRKIGGEDEEDVYRVLGLPYIPPELREDHGEIEAAMEGKLPKLIDVKDIKGDLHVHSKWSDGSYNFQQLIDAAKKKGYSYIAITDHSKGLGVAKGLTGQRLLEQKREIQKINEGLRDFRIVHGVEVDIRSDGSLDIDDETLKELDIVVASIHSGFKQPKKQLTYRLVSAMKNPYVSIIAHPTGRLIGERDPYEVDMDEILEVAKKTYTALEINAYPLRLDLNDTYAKRAKEMGISLVISTDTHLLTHYDYMDYGIHVARRGWLTKRDVLNTLDVKELLKRLKPKMVRD